MDIKIAERSLKGWDRKRNGDRNGEMEGTKDGLKNRRKNREEEEGRGTWVETFCTGTSSRDSTYLCYKNLMRFGYSYEYI